MLKLYSYFRSSASYRARIALHFKELPFEYVPIHLVKGEQKSEKFLSINPMKHVPALVHDDFLIAETVAIFRYLDDVFPAKPLFPKTPRENALVLQICEIVNSGIQPLQNLKVTKYLEANHGFSKDQGDAFIRHWITEGFVGLEKLLERTAGTYALGGSVTAADAFIVPQCFAARRFNIGLEQFPNLARVNANAVQVEAFKKAHPERQPDFQG